jgi:hypothetical protein
MKHLALKLAARLTLWTNFWCKNETTGGSYHITFTTAFEILYKGITGEEFIYGPRQYPTEETIRRIWVLKQQNLVEVFLDSPWAPHYAIDPTHELRIFFTEVADFISRLSISDQSDLYLEVLRCANNRPSNSLHKLQQFKSISCLPQEIRVTENGGSTAGC